MSKSKLRYHNNHLTVDGHDLLQIASTYGTPTYLYSADQITSNWNKFKDAFTSLTTHICYAVKACSNIAILNLLAQQNAGFDIVSGGELYRVLKAGGDSKKIVFSGVGKTIDELKYAIDADIACFNVESVSELKLLSAILQQTNKTINIALRINPNVDAKTHVHITTGTKESKFGIEYADITECLSILKTNPKLNLQGIACHIGSQIVDLNPFNQMLDFTLKIYHELQSQHMNLQSINIGGGLGIRYHNESIVSLQEYVDLIKTKFASLPITLILEPGRFIVGNAGWLLTRILYLKNHKDHHFAVVDAGMNDLCRPALYNAWHDIYPITELPQQAHKLYDVVGPVCESADFIGKERLFTLSENELLLIGNAGAYGFSMSSNYNSRLRAAELLLFSEKIHLIRERETYQSLTQQEHIFKD